MDELNDDKRYAAWTPEGQDKHPTRFSRRTLLGGGGAVAGNFALGAVPDMSHLGRQVDAGLRVLDKISDRWGRRASGSVDSVDALSPRVEFEQHQHMGQIFIPGLGKSAEVLHVKNTPGVRELQIDGHRKTWGFLDFPVDKTGQLGETDWPGSYSYDPNNPHHIGTTGSNTVIVGHNVSMYENPNGVFNQMSLLNPGDLIYVVNDNELETPTVSVFVVDGRPFNRAQSWEIVTADQWQVTARPPELEQEFTPPKCTTTPCVQVFDPLDVIHRLTMFTCIEDQDNLGYEDPDRRLMVTARLAVQFDCVDPFDQSRLRFYRSHGRQIVEGASSFGNVLTWLMQRSERMGDESWWPQGVHPEIDARLDPEFHAIMGTPEGDDYLAQLYNQYGFGVHPVG